MNAERARAVKMSLGLADKQLAVEYCDDPARRGEQGVGRLCWRTDRSEPSGKRRNQQGSAGRSEAQLRTGRAVVEAARQVSAVVVPWTRAAAPRVSCRYTYSERSGRASALPPGAAEIQLNAAMDDMNKSLQVQSVFMRFPFIVDSLYSRDWTRSVRWRTLVRAC
jgi:hypothetical protein